MPSQTAPNAGSQSNEPFSFEAKIAMALQGAKWQELQRSTENVVPTPPEAIQDGALIDAVVAEDAVDEQRPPELTAKQKKKKEQFARTIARDAGEVLATIEPDSLVGVPQDVTWDKDPELLCCYNWQASTDETNTIFGKSRACLSSIHFLQVKQHARGALKLSRTIPNIYLHCFSPRSTSKMATGHVTPYTGSRQRLSICRLQLCAPTTNTLRPHVLRSERHEPLLPIHGRRRPRRPQQLARLARVCIRTC